MFRLSAFLGTLFLVLVPSNGAVAQGDPPASTPGPAPWDAFCAGQGRREALDCEIRQRVVVSGTEQLLAGITIKVPSEASASLTMMVQTPYGLFLPAGLRFAVDGAEMLSLSLQTCDGNGCYAGSPVSADLLAKMQRGET